MSDEQVVVLCVFVVAALAVWLVIRLDMRAERRQQEWFDRQEYLPRHLHAGKSESGQ